MDKDKMDADENYRFIIDSSWKDIHHSRNQDWTALAFVIGAHFGIYNLLTHIEIETTWTISNIHYGIGFIIGICLSFVGGLIAWRHNSLQQKKLYWITSAEYKLGLLKTEKNFDGVIDIYNTDENIEECLKDYDSYKKYFKNKKIYKGLSVYFLIIAFYILIFLIDIMILAIL